MVNHIFRISTFLTISCFFLLIPAFADEQNGSIHIYRLANSYFGNIQDNEVILELDDLSYVALKNNQMIEVVRQKQAQTQGQLTQAQSGYLPHLTVEGRYFYTERQNSASSDEFGVSNPDATQASSDLGAIAGEELEEDDID